MTNKIKKKRKEEGEEFTIPNDDTMMQHHDILHYRNE